MIGVRSTGNFDKTRAFINKVLKKDIYGNLESYARIGVDALSSVTPVDTGLTQLSWGYRIVRDRDRIGIEWYNTNAVNGTPVVILLQYGHGTGTGGYVAGFDFINPAMRPVFDQIADDVWKEVVS